ncbi:hypothetical protein BLA29_015052 [Euroglyphus maynei]|uniref:Uncharacterized protein n=1 Tax=Euroglyphus maynei TaxID=6958 RepID=A0A1Y3BBH9_EURMA|nr:hypothetical protein BLA29_015052 [Euroglyphus maynei]
MRIKLLSLIVARMLKKVPMRN